MELIERFQRLAQLAGATHEYKVRYAGKYDSCWYGRRCNTVFGACIYSCETCGCHNQIRLCIIEDDLIKRFCNKVCAELWVDIRLAYLAARSVLSSQDYEQFLEAEGTIEREARMSEDPDIIRETIRGIIGEAHKASTPQ